jgi:hypothetical protein
MYTKSSHVGEVVTIRRQAWGQYLGGGIEEARKLAGLSIEEAAEAAGMEASEWRAIEAGHAPDDRTGCSMKGPDDFACLDRDTRSSFYAQPMSSLRAAFGCSIPDGQCLGFD